MFINLEWDFHIGVLALFHVIITEFGSGMYSELWDRHHQQFGLVLQEKMTFHEFSMIFMCTHWIILTKHNNVHDFFQIFFSKSPPSKFTIYHRTQDTGHVLYLAIRHSRGTISMKVYEPSTLIHLFLMVHSYISRTHPNCWWCMSHNSEYIPEPNSVIITWKRAKTPMWKSHSRLMNIPTHQRLS